MVTLVIGLLAFVLAAFGGFAVSTGVDVDAIAGSSTPVTDAIEMILDGGGADDAATGSLASDFRLA